MDSLPPGDRAPEEIGPFRILRDLGPRPLGAAFVATQHGHMVPVVLRTFPRGEAAPLIVAGVQRLIAHGKIHRSITRVMVVGTTDDLVYVAESFPPGESLQTLMQTSHAMSASNVARLIGVVAAALDASSRLGWDHGALHPADVFVGGYDVYVMGVGLTRILEDAGVARVPSDRYAAFERWTGNWDRRADVFSLASIAFELLTQRPPDLSIETSLDAIAPAPGVDVEALRVVLGRALANAATERHDDVMSFSKGLSATITEVPDPDVEDVVMPESWCHEDVGAAPNESWRSSHATPTSAAPGDTLTMFARKLPGVWRHSSAAVATRIRAGARTAAVVAGEQARAWQTKLRPLSWRLVAGHSAAVVVGVTIAIAGGSLPARALAATAADAAGQAWSVLRGGGQTGSGRLYLSSTPPNAHLLIDGRDAGNGSATISNMRFGAHEITFVLDGYQPVVRTISLGPDTVEQRLHVTLTENGRDIVLRKDAAPARRPAAQRRRSS